MEPSKGEMVAAGVYLNRKTPGFPTTPKLSSREGEILHLLGAGLRIFQICGKLRIGEGAAEAHIARIYVKLGATTRADAVAQARQLGLIGPPEER